MLPEFLTAAAQHQVRYLVVQSSDAGVRGQAGRIVSWALDCLPVQHSRRWLVVDLTQPPAAGGHCTAP